MRASLKLSQKALVLVGSILIFELMFLFSLGWLVKQSRSEALREAETKAIAGEILDTFTKLSDSTAAIASQEHVGATAALKDFERTIARLKAAMRDLSIRVKAYPDYRQRVEKILRTLLIGARAVEEAGHMIENQEYGALASFSEEFKQHDFEESLWSEIGLLLKEHDMRLAKGAEVQRQNRAVIEFLLVGAVFINIIFAIALATMFVRTIANRIIMLSENSERLALGTDLLPAMTDTDEIGQLDKSFREMAATLAESARKERAIIENSSDVMCSLNEQAAFIKVSPASIHLWGFQPEDLVGKAFINLVVPGDKKECTAALDQLKRGEQHEFEARMRKQDGSLVYMLCSGQWSETDSSFFLVAHDITTRKLTQALLTASEQRVRAMLDNMLVGLMTTTFDGTIEMLNSRTAEILGYSLQQLSGKAIVELFPRSRTQNAPDFCKQVLSTESGKVCEFDALCSNGLLLPVEISMTEFFTIDGDRLLVNIVDISQRRQIERMKEEFVAMISHDLRTPLNSVNGFMELLEDGLYGELTETGEDRAALAIRNVDRLLRLINDLLEVTKLESGQLELHRETVSAKSMITRSIESVRDFADKHNVLLAQEGEDISLEADGHRIERVIVNLLSNAVKFSPAEATVTVEAKCLGDEIEFTVKDEGLGVPESHRELIFERYRQVRASDSTKKGGTGLGLAICKAIVEQHGGSIGVISEEGKGSTFWFRLPGNENHS